MSVGWRPTDVRARRGHLTMREVKGTEFTSLPATIHFYTLQQLGYRSSCPSRRPQLQ